MRPVALDYSRPLPRRPGVALILLALALASMMYVWETYRELTAALAERNAIVFARDPAQHASAHRAAVDSQAIQAELSRAQRTISHLTFPWEGIFNSLEQTQRPGVALLSVSPKADDNTVTIGGEAKDYDALLDYVQKLQRHSHFSGVYLLNHQIQAQDPQKPLRFQVLAHWIPSP